VNIGPNRTKGELFVPRRLLPCTVLLFFLAQVSPFLVSSAEETAPSPKAEPKVEKTYTTESLRGKVVWLAESLKERFGIKTDDDAAHAVVALETAEGELHPILKDARGRGFHTDERLRGIELELRVRRYRGSPMVQVVRVYTLKPDGKYELDYWCDVCSIAMYELKPCECCQGPIRLRERLAEGQKSGEK
jgi:hypothetical protein